MTKKEKEIMIELFNQGVPKAKIAKQLNYAPITILRNLRQLNIEQPSDPMIGKIFYYLTVLQRAEKREDLASRCIRYICKCKCGNIIEVNGNSLRTGHTRSCGCLQKENISYKDLTGQKFGKLTIISLSGSNGKRKIWHCQCDCGNECDIIGHNLINGSVKSCGCLHSYKELEIKNFLEQHGVSFIKEYTFSDLRGKSKPLRFDFAILNSSGQLLCLIEYQGVQHFDIDNKWHSQQLVESDKRKYEYCRLKKIPLFYLDKESNLEVELERIIKNYGI